MSVGPSNQALALVARGPASAGEWKLESVVPRPIKDDELLVRIVASGICLADIHFGDISVEESIGNPFMWYPRVLGHEGAGYVEQVGRSVRNVSPGDPVILSYLSCGTCYNCQDDHPAYCIHCFDCNFSGERNMYARAGGQDLDIGASFFGQSSFANKAIVKERSVINLRGLGVTKEELQVLAPLGCGVQTGSGAFVNIADVKAHEEVLVMGVGGVGQSAIMAAAMAGCKTIIAIDQHQSRLELAQSLGATHIINTTDRAVDLVSEVLKLTGGKGVHVSLDTTGVQELARKSWDCVRCHGKVLQVGLAKPEALWNISMADHMNSGKQIIGCVQGDAIPQDYVPQMIEWYRKGKLPVDKLVTTYPLAEYQRALQDMRKGVTIKPVLLWPDRGPNVSHI